MGTPDQLPADGIGADDAAAQMLGKLAAMEVARKAQREQRQQAAKELADPRESVDGFLAWFAQQQAEVQQRCAQIQADRAASGDSDSTAGTAPLQQQEVQQHQQQLDGLLEQVSVLERAAAEASYFLPPYDLRQATASAQELRQQLENAKAALVPKRKFAFSSKRVSRVKANEAAPVGSTDAPTSSTNGGHTGSFSPPAAAAASVGAGAPGSAAAVGQAAAAAAASAPAAAVSAHDLELVKAGHGLMGLRDREVVVQAAEHAGSDFVLIDCQRCSIWLLGPMPALRVQGLLHCRLYAGPIGGAAFVSHATSSTLMLSAQQVRIHSSSASDFYLSVRSKPIIEHCNGLRFAPFVDVQRALPGTVSSSGANSTEVPLNTSSSQSGASRSQCSSGAGGCDGGGEQHTRIGTSASSSSSGPSTSSSGPSSLGSGGTSTAALGPAADTNASSSGGGGVAGGAVAADVAGLWCQVEDFGWIKAAQSPHWCVLPLQDRVQAAAPPQEPGQQ